MLRVFKVGHALEDLAIRWLRLAGFELYTQKATGGQFGFSVAGGRIQGHVDGILAAGPPELDLRYPALWECKTMNDKSWRETVKHGVSKAKPIYAAQLALYQAYMEGPVTGISSNPALFTAINKDSQELWCERVPFDGGLAQRALTVVVERLNAGSGTFGQSMPLSGIICQCDACSRPATSTAGCVRLGCPMTRFARRWKK